MEQAYKNLIIVAIMFIVFIVALAFNDYYCFTHEDRSQNLSINECGSREYLEQKYWVYLRHIGNKTIYTNYVNLSNNGQR